MAAVYLIFTVFFSLCGAEIVPVDVSYTASVGDEVQLIWNYDNDTSMFSVDWTFQSENANTPQSIMTQKAGSAALILNNYNVEHGGNGNITLKSVTMESSGIYYCSVTYKLVSGLTPVTGTATLAVHEATQVYNCTGLGNSKAFDDKVTCVSVLCVCGCCGFILALIMIGIGLGCILILCAPCCCDRFYDSESCKDCCCVCFYDKKTSKDGVNNSCCDPCCGCCNITELPYWYQVLWTSVIGCPVAFGIWVVWKCSNNIKRWNWISIPNRVYSRLHEMAVLPFNIAAFPRPGNQITYNIRLNNEAPVASVRYENGLFTPAQVKPGYSVTGDPDGIVKLYIQNVEGNKEGKYSISGGGSPKRYTYLHILDIPSRVYSILDEMAVLPFNIKAFLRPGNQITYNIGLRDEAPVASVRYKNGVFTPAQVKPGYSVTGDPDGIVKLTIQNVEEEKEGKYSISVGGSQIKYAYLYIQEFSNRVYSRLNKKAVLPFDIAAFLRRDNQITYNIGVRDEAPVASVRYENGVFTPAQVKPGYSVTGDPDGIVQLTIQNVEADKEGIYSISGGGAPKQYACLYIQVFSRIKEEAVLPFDMSKYIEPKNSITFNILNDKSEHVASVRYENGEVKTQQVQPGYSVIADADGKVELTIQEVGDDKKGKYSISGGGSQKRYAYLCNPGKSDEDDTSRDVESTRSSPKNANSKLLNEKKQNSATGKAEGVNKGKHVSDTQIQDKDKSQKVHSEKNFRPQPQPPPGANINHSQLPNIPGHDKKGRGLSSNFEDDDHPLVAIDIPAQKAGALPTITDTPRENKKKTKKKKKHKEEDNQNTETVLNF